MTHGGKRRDDFRSQLDEADLRLDAVDLVLDADTLHQIALFRRAMRDDLNRMEKNIMADLTRLQTALDALGVDTAEVSAKIDDLKAQIAALSAGQITQQQIDDLATAAEAVDASLDTSTAPDAPTV